MPSYRVEVGFQPTNKIFGFLSLNSGQLDVDQLFGSNVFFDVTDRVRSITITRGKSRQLDRYNSGQASVDFSNEDRAFDPTFAASPFFGEVFPKRKIRIFVDNVLAFVGIIDDWDLNYSLNGLSLATANASDAFVILANRSITPGTSTLQLSGARVQAILNDPLVSFPLAEREIDTGKIQLGADIIEENTNALSYLQNVETSEGGNLFVAANGNLVFREKNSLGAITAIRFADDGTGIPYGNLAVSYGSELLYNEINLTSAITTTTVTASDIPSQSAYGILTLDLDQLLIADDLELQALANFYLAKYKEPEFRFESLRVNLNGLSSPEQIQVIGLELGDLVSATFTPNGISPAVEQFSQIASISHDVSLDNHIVTIGLESFGPVPFRLDSDLFGKLDTNTLG